MCGGLCLAERIAIGTLADQRCGQLIADNARPRSSPRDHSGRGKRISLARHHIRRSGRLLRTAVQLHEADSSELQTWETEIMRSIDKKLEKEVKEGKIPKPIEDLPFEWAKEDREIDGGKPDLGEVEEDPSEL